MPLVLEICSDLVDLSVALPNQKKEIEGRAMMESSTSITVMNFWSTASKRTEKGEHVSR